MKKEEKNYILLKNFAMAREINLFGVANVIEVRDEFLLNKNISKYFDKAISLGYKLNDCILEEIENKPTKLYFHHYRQVNFLLDRVALSLSHFIQQMGYKALPIPASQIIDWEKQKAHLSHKKIGMLAGLGWIGRNNLLVNPEIGARFRLVTILTDIPLKVDEPLERDCGECKACITVCPANAIKEKKEDFNHLACFEKLKEFRKEGISNQYICGVCVKHCKGFKK